MLVMWALERTPRNAGGSGMEFEYELDYKREERSYMGLKL